MLQRLRTWRHPARSQASKTHFPARMSSARGVPAASYDGIGQGLDLIKIAFPRASTAQTSARFLLVSSRRHGPGKEHCRDIRLRQHQQQQHQHGAEVMSPGIA